MEAAPLLLLLLLLQHQSLAVRVEDTVPSCLRGNITWDQAAVYDIVVSVPSPEDCQQLCYDDPSCAGQTWFTEGSVLVPRSCLLFSSLGEETVCQDCVSGPPECLCSVSGECEAVENNIIDVFTNIATETECSALCGNTSDCAAYTYFGDGNALRHMCLLFNSCDKFTEDCDDCSTGFPDCDVCNFEDTQPDGSCDRCGDWDAAHGDFCYKRLEGYHDIAACRADCVALGGLLASVHDTAENSLVYSITGGHWTWLGARRTGQGNDFAWDDSTAWDYDNWYPGQPDGGDCVVLGYYLSPDKWLDAVCHTSSNRDCVCKKRQ